MEQWQAMLRETGSHIGSPRTATREEMTYRATNLPTVVWYSLTSGAVVYATEQRLAEWHARIQQGHF